MEKLLQQLTYCVERGKVDQNSNYPPEMRGQDGAVEIARQALAEGFSAQDILTRALMPAMRNVGERFGCGQAFLPDLMIAAKAMTAATTILKPHFESGDAPRKGRFIIGTVAGDLHDIGKNIVKMILEGAGWEVVDLGSDVSTAKFLQAVQENPGAAVGMSALLTTTMQNMEVTVRELKSKYPGLPVVIGGAPVTEKFREKIGADAYFSSPHSLPDYLEKFISQTQ